MTGLTGLTGLSGTGALLRLALRRDRVMIPVWLLAVAGTVAATVSSYQGLYPHPADLRPVAAEVSGSPALIATSGPPFGLLTVGGLTAWKIGGFLAVLAGVLNLLLVVRHTRAEEDAGRLELIRAAVVGRRAGLAAALLLVTLTDLLLAVLVAAGCAGYGLAFAGALALGAATGLAGLAVAGVAAVAAQLAAAPRTASAIAGGVLGASFVLRAAGDSTGPGWLSWLGPVGWAQQVRPYAGERWLVLLLPLATFGALAPAALVLAGRRDLGAALLADRPGPARGAIRTPLGLAGRLQRSGIAAWLAGFAVSGVLFGSIGPSLDGTLADNQQLGDLLQRFGGGQGILDGFVSTVIRFAALVAAVPAVASVLNLRTEEATGRLEPVLATGAGRTRWAAAGLALTLAASAAMLAVFGAGLAAGSALAGADLGLDPLAGALLQLPAVWVVAGVPVLLFGLLPRWSALGWGVLGAVLVISWIGPLLQVDQLVLDLSPFTHVPGYPAAELRWPPELWLLATALALTGAGLAAWRRRDLAP